MQIKTNTLTGAALDWAVLEALKPDLKNPKLARIGTFGPLFGKGYKYPSLSSWKFDPSTNWSQGGPIIEREGISVFCGGLGATGYWNAYYADRDEWHDVDLHKQVAPTPLSAAMRCFVASRLGNEVDIPEELK
jgi:hypothetical protein